MNRVFLFVATFVTAALASVGEIRTCSGCKLNRLHEVRKFVYDEAKKYDNMNVKFIGGHNPDLIIFNADGGEIERLDLSPLNMRQIHELFRSKGFVLKAGNSSEL